MNGSRGPPPLPPGMDKHHIVVVDGIHVPMPEFNFPYTITIHKSTQQSEVAERIKDASIVVTCLCPILPEHMTNAPHLRAIGILATGHDWVDKAWCAEHNITVTNTPQSNITACGEHFLALYFASRKKVVEMHRTVTTTREWADKRTLTSHWHLGPPPSCRQEVLGIVGYGPLGKRVEEISRAVGFGEVLVGDRKGAKGSDTREGRVELEEVWEKSSVIAVTCPKNGDTTGLIGEQELKMMRKDAVVINMARGGIVDEHALAKALRERWIAAAATDVMDGEPVGVGDSPLLPDVEKGEEEVPNLTISPHIAWFSQGTVQNLQRLLKTGIEGYVSGTCYDEQVRFTVRIHDGKIWQ